MISHKSHKVYYNEGHLSILFPSNLAGMLTKELGRVKFELKFSAT